MARGKKDVKEIIEKNAVKIIKTAIENMEQNPAVINKLIDKVIPKDTDNEIKEQEQRYREYITEIKKISEKLKENDRITIPSIL